MQRSSSVSLPLRTNRTIFSILWPLLLLLLVLLIGLHQKVDSHHHHHHHQEEAAAMIEEKPLFRVKRQSSSSTAAERNRALGPSDDNGTRPEPPKALMVGTGVRVWTSSSRQSLPSSSSQLPGGQARRVRDDNDGGGELRLVGGRSLFEGNVEIRHAGKWGSICDDEWDIVEAGIVCRQLGFVLGAIRATTDSHFGIGRRLVWMDDLFCSGSEDEIQKCPFAGWRKHNCGQNEAAGVVCATGNNPDKRQIAPRSDLPSPRATNINLERQVSSQNTSIVVAKPKKEHEHQKFGSWAPNKKKAAEEEADGEEGEEIAIRLIGDRASHEGRVEVWFRRRWRVICGDGWSLPEANVVCRQLGLGAAQSLPRVNLADLAVPRFSLPPILSGLKCSGNEAHLAQCTLEAAAADSCPDSYRNLAGLVCATGIVIGPGPRRVWTWPNGGLISNNRPRN